MVPTLLAQVPTTGVRRASGLGLGLKKLFALFTHASSSQQSLPIYSYVEEEKSQ